MKLHVIILKKVRLIPVKSSQIWVYLVKWVENDMNRLDEKSIDILIRLLHKEHCGRTRKQAVREIAEENSVGVQAIGNRLSSALICLASATDCDTANLRADYVLSAMGAKYGHGISAYCAAVTRWIQLAMNDMERSPMWSVVPMKGEIPTPQELLAFLIKSFRLEISSYIKKSVDLHGDYKYNPFADALKEIQEQAESRIKLYEIRVYDASNNMIEKACYPARKELIEKTYSAMRAGYSRFTVRYLSAFERRWITCRVYSKGDWPVFENPVERQAVYYDSSDEVISRETYSEVVTYKSIKEQLVSLNGLYAVVLCRKTGGGKLFIDACIYNKDCKTEYKGLLAYLLEKIENSPADYADLRNPST